MNSGQLDQQYDCSHTRAEITMRSLPFTALCYLLLSLVGLASATKKPSGPVAPGLSHLYTLNITAGETYPVGAGPRGTRIILSIVSGVFAGPKLKGKNSRLPHDSFTTHT